VPLLALWHSRRVRNCCAPRVVVYVSRSGIIALLTRGLVPG
jgi:hypothetical protein